MILRILGWLTGVTLMMSVIACNSDRKETSEDVMDVDETLADWSQDGGFEEKVSAY